MKGLLIKDLRLLIHNKMMLIIWFVIIVLAGQDYDNYSFIIGYTMMIGIILVFNTISYDEYDKSIVYLMTLPMRRETYVREKYLLMVAGGLIGGIGSTAVCMLLHNDIAQSILIEAIAIMLVMLLMQAVMLPIQLKFGGEKGRAVILLMLGCIAAVMITLGKTVHRIFNVPEDVKNLIIYQVTQFVNRFLSLDLWIRCLILLLLYGLCLAASYSISCGIMRKREF